MAVTPYYDEDGITIYHGDCRNVLSDVLADVLITDPPYGVELGSSDRRGDGHGLAKATYRTYQDSYGMLVMSVIPPMMRFLSRVHRGALFPGKYVTLYPQPDALGGVYCPSGVGRNSWGYTCFFPVFFYGVCPTLQYGAASTVLHSTEVAERNGHPCPKPIGWLYWLVTLASLLNECICDPFMGSGTTLIAAKRLGRKAIGIELDEQYCEMAVQRLSQGVLPLNLATAESLRLQGELFV